MKTGTTNDLRLFGLRMPSPCLSLLPLLLLTPSPDQRDVLWDNHIILKGDITGRAISPPAFPNIRVVDDIPVTIRTRWHVTSAWLNTIEDSAWQPGEAMEIFVWKQAASGGGGPHPGQDGIVAWRRAPLRRSATGATYFGRAAYIHGIEDLDLVLGADAKFVGFRHPEGSGSGTAYWLTSDGLNEHNRGLRQYFSLDAGKSWANAGQRWHNSFILYGYEEPSVPPSFFIISRGAHVSGGTISLSRVDDDRLVISPRRPIEVNAPSAELIVNSNVGPNSGAAWLSFTMFANVTAQGVDQEVWLWDNVNRRWVLAHFRPADTEEAFSFRRYRAGTVFDTDPTLFVAPDGTVTARIRWFDRGVPSVGWTVQVNQVGWHAILN